MSIDIHTHKTSASLESIFRNSCMEEACYTISFPAMSKLAFQNQFNFTHTPSASPVCRSFVFIQADVHYTHSENWPQSCLKRQDIVGEGGGGRLDGKF